MLNISRSYVSRIEKKAIEKLKDEIKNVSDSEASAAFEECKAKRVELHTKEKEVELLEQKNKELEKLGENPDESKKKDIEDSFNAKIESLKKDAKVKIDGFKEKAKKFLNSPSDTKELDKELKELEKQKEKLVDYCCCCCNSDCCWPFKHGSFWSTKSIRSLYPYYRIRCFRNRTFC